MLLETVKGAGALRAPDATEELLLQSVTPECVSRDMENIFGSAGVASAREKPREPDAIVPIVTESSERWQMWLIGIALVALSGVLIAGSLAWMGLSARSIQASVALPQVMVASAAAPSGAAHVRAQQAHAASAAVAPPAKLIEPEQAAPAATLMPKPEAAAAQSPTVTQPVKQAAQSDGPTDCSQPGNSASSTCLYPQVLAADQQLRAAFDRATNAGIDPKVLTAYRDRWWQVRKDATTDPAYAKAAYQQLARELDAAHGSS